MPWHVVYTRPFRERAAEIALRDAGAVETLIPVHAASVDGNSAGDFQRALLFPNYVFFNAEFCETTRAAIARAEAICYVLGANQKYPSTLDFADIYLIRELMQTNRFPLLGEAPRLGMKARIVEGPLSGLEGTVISSGEQEVRLATVVRLVGEVCEISVPLHAITLLGVEESRLGSHPRHRGGRRSHRRSLAGEKYSRPVSQTG